jgi:protein-L-isoaspartate O-methyltransferase
MLDILQFKPGHKVFELGAGSGWNAALMGHLVGPEGHVYSLEIIPVVARTAAAIIEQLGIKNVNIIEADGGEGYAKGAPYDRVIFTAGAYDLPHHFFEQIKNGGLLLIVIKNEGGGDNLFLLRKTSDHFESLESMICGFVQMTGKYRITDSDPIDLTVLSEWPELKEDELARRNFWWGGKGKNGFTLRTHGIRSFLSITEPYFKTFKTEKTCEEFYEEQYFGLWDKENLSLVIAKDDMLISYGNLSAEERLIEDIQRWVNLGMPSAASFDLKIYPLNIHLSSGENQWIVKRNEAQFLWSLKI